jgi:DNA-binding transcriptional LysR family regulator
MDLDWLEDFAALAENGNFSRAAEMRHVTQPAFSRRIRALEDWVGVPLFRREPHGITLTAAGEEFRHGAEEMIRRIRHLRGDAREAAGRDAATLRFAATHALSFTFFPGWIRRVDPAADFAGIQLISDHMRACEALMLSGRAQFLMCHHHDSVPSRLRGGQFLSVIVGDDRLIPLCAADGDRPLWRLPGSPSAPLKLLAYSDESGLGRIVAADWQRDERGVCGATVFTSHLAAALLSMARDGHGIAWLPTSLAEAGIAAGTLVRSGDADWDIPLQIRLFRPRSRLSRAAERLWDAVAS